jgi:hypothetical protein
MTTQIDIKAMALKHELVVRVDSPYANDYLKRQQAFADEYLALSSSEPVAHIKYFSHQLFLGADLGFDLIEGLEVCDKDELGSDGSPAFAVYTANPLNQQLQTERDAFRSQLIEIYEKGITENTYFEIKKLLPELENI